MPAPNLFRAEMVVNQYVAQILEPVEELLKDMSKEIPLDPEGANKLKVA